MTLQRNKSQGLASRLVVLLWIATSGLVGLDGQTTGDPQARASFHATIDPVVDALWTAFDERAALDHVRFISQYWRLPGNTGYNASLDRIRDRLVSAGFAANTSSAAPRIVVEEYANSGHAWEYTTGTVAIVRPGAQDEIALSRDKDRLALCINSFSTAPEGVVARLVDVGAGRDADYLGKDLKGAVAERDSAFQAGEVLHAHARRAPTARRRNRAVEPHRHRDCSRARGLSPRNSDPSCVSGRDEHLSESCR